jgi:transposase
MERMVLELEEMTITKTKTYKKYGPEQIARFTHILQETGATVPKAAEACGIPTSSAYKLLSQFNDSNGTILPGSRSTQKGKAKPKKLFPVHTAFLIHLFDANPSTVLEMAREELMKQFGVSVAISSLYMHIREKCCLTLNQASKYTIERDAPRTLDLRYEIINK